MKEKKNKPTKNMWPQINVRPLLVESLVLAIFYVIFLMCYTVIIKIFFQLRQQEVKNCFKF